jgi:hypothetical protein
MMYFGCNQNHWADVALHVSGMTIQRSFKPLSGGWPVMPEGVLAHWSIRPDPDKLLSGRLDSQIITALQSALPGSLLTGWHEAEHVGSPIGSVVMRDVHRYLHNLVHDHTDNVQYGAVTTSGASASWVATGLDFYGVDQYDIHGSTDVGDALTKWSNRMPVGYRVIAETNSSVKAHRPAWFRESFEWLKDHNGISLTTFWNPTGPLSGPWIDDDWPTIYSLKGISRDAAAA